MQHAATEDPARRSPGISEQSAYAQQPQYAQPQYAQPAPPPPPVAASDADDMFSQLQKLGELRVNGILTDDEFAAQKARILAG